MGWEAWGGHSGVGVGAGWGGDRQVGYGVGLGLGSAWRLGQAVSQGGCQWGQVGTWGMGVWEAGAVEGKGLGNGWEGNGEGQGSVAGR